MQYAWVLYIQADNGKEYVFRILANKTEAESFMDSFPHVKFRLEYRAVDSN